MTFFCASELERSVGFMFIDAIIAFRRRVRASSLCGYLRFCVMIDDDDDDCRL